MKKVYSFLIIIFILLASIPSNAEQPDVNAIIKKVKSAWDARPVSFKVTIIVKDGERITGEMVAGAAHKSFPDGRRLLIVILEPESLKGLAYLLNNLDTKLSEQWMYLPYIDRVRKIDGMSNYENFLSTDFTFADLALLDIQNDNYKYLGEEEVGGIKAYKIESTSKIPNYYYSKIITWIAKDSSQILRRDYYSPNNSLWKRQLYENLTLVNGLLIPLRIRVMDLQHKTSTELNISEIDADITLPNEIFVPEQLKYSLKCPVWQKVCYPQDVTVPINKNIKAK
ncbi:MAG: outer membrane lipoprotein-sorting protein [Proteobacteria bacterium]|nr:outer membrane lipoprotein-sorting protein [Pseudomonadota bacterium]MBU4037030.1 outer membrane lipoprotein-sorting protein [Pseudomonadota bacterium]